MRIIVNRTLYSPAEADVVRLFDWFSSLDIFPLLFHISLLDYTSTCGNGSSLVI
mgnify:CR=1 FL=1